jgi:CAAX prenyl protease-like protein
VVFAFWVAIDHWIGEDMTGRDAAGSGVILTGVAEGLARLSVNQRHVWIALRTLAAVVTVPLAEELAFRGYIARRFMSADVESIPFASLSVFAVVGSSLAFGILHGRMWLAGVMAGLVFAVVAKLRGRLGDAVAAHATANLLLAFWVIARGDYSLW